MFDLLLSWAVTVLAVVIGFLLIFVPPKEENEHRHRRWLRILGGLLIFYGFLAWFQQARATKAAAKDRQEAIIATAAETSKQVR